MWDILVRHLHYIHTPLETRVESRVSYKLWMEKHVGVLISAQVHLKRESMVCYFNGICSTLGLLRHTWN